MIEMIDKYRSSPERTHIKMGFLSCIRITNGQKGKIAKNSPLGALNGSKRGCYICKKEIDLLLCDLAAVLGGALIGCILMKKLCAAMKNTGKSSGCCDKNM